MEQLHKWTVVSFYTKEYDKDADRLISSLKKFNVPYEIDKIESLGTWDLNTNHKATFIKKKLLARKKPVVWIDADAEVVKYPKLFDVIDEDVGVHYMNLKTVNSGTVFFNYTDNALKVLERWEQNSRNTDIWDQKHLQHVLLGEHFELHKTTVFYLPCSYCYIFDLMKGWCEPVIKHYQSSRRWRKHG